VRLTRCANEGYCLRQKQAPCLSESVELAKRIRYSDHLKLRMSLRRIPRPLPRSIYQRAKEVFYDHTTGHLVAVARSRYGGRLREMMVAYSEVKDEVTLITVHPFEASAKNEPNCVREVDSS
jgi:hypothetical protein